MRALIGADRWKRAAIAVVALGVMAGAAPPAWAHSASYGGRAKTYRVGTPTESGANRCGHGVYSGPRTGCGLARNVFAVFARRERRLGHPPGFVRARGGASQRPQRFACEIAGNDHFVVCTAKSGALVDFGVSAAAHGAHPAQTARSCGDLTGPPGFRTRLPISATGVSCARARRLAGAWQRRARIGEPRSSLCTPNQLRAPHKTCVVQGWRCTAGQSPDGATIPVTCTRRHRRVHFRAPV